MDTFSGAGASDIGDDYGDTITTDDDTVNLSDVPMVPPPDVQQQLDASGDSIQSMRDELRRSALEDQKKRLVDTFYNEVHGAYRLRPGRIDYRQFGTW